jgi:uncharacterized membrane-anchored protein YitT (DUF2179 family)
MKSKQLANVLIKILGLSVFIEAIPHIINGLFQALVMAEAGRVNGPGLSGFSLWVFPACNLGLLILGVFLIKKSQCVTTLLFKEEED